MGPQTQLYSYLISNPPTDHPGIPGCVAGVVCCLDDRPCFPGHGDGRHSDQRAECQLYGQQRSTVRHFLDL
eukprot:g20154.t1